MSQDRDEEIAASVGAHRDLGPAYDDAIAAGLVERIGAEVDRRVDERISQYERYGRPAAGRVGDSEPAASQPAPHAQHLPAVQAGRQISWQQASLALGSMVIGAITSATINTAHGNGTWPIIVVWIAIVVINMAIFRAGRPSRRDRRPRDSDRLSSGG
jgi:hypothetical protein